MRILVLGGTRFLGRAVVRAALDQGAQVTSFTRGISGEPPPGVTALHGDRTVADDLAVLRDGEWDAVIDTSGYVPAHVGAGARLLADRAGHYVFVSTLNVYPRWGKEPITDESATHDCPPYAGPGDAPDDEVARYGYLKVGCERAVAAHFPGRYTVARAGLIIGPHDDTGRLTWWLRRISQGGEVLAPGDPAQPRSLVDARDLAAWFLHCARARVTGACVATAPIGQTTMGGLLETLREVTGSDASFTWVPDEELGRHDVQPWTQLPLWLPTNLMAHPWHADASGAQALGLTCRPIRDTAADTWAWQRELAELPGRDSTPPTGLPPGTERAILSAWHARPS